MSRSLKIRLRKMIFSPEMLLSILAGLFLLMWFHVKNYIGYVKLHGAKESLNMAYVFLDDINMSHSLNVYGLFTPVLAVLPAASVFCDDYNTGYLRAILGRVDKKRYAFECFVCSSISGGIALMLPCLITTIIFIAGGHMNSPVSDNHFGYHTVFDSTVYSQLQFVWNGIFLALFFLLLAFLFGAFCSNAGLAISVFFPNKYAVVTLPFVFYFVQHLFLYKTGLVVFSLNNIMMPAADFIPYAAFPLVYQMVWLVAVALVYSTGIRRRLTDA